MVEMRGLGQREEVKRGGKHSENLRERGHGKWCVVTAGKPRDVQRLGRQERVEANDIMDRITGLT